MKKPSLQLLTLWALAVAQPIYDLLGRNPAFFVYRRCEPLELGGFALAISLLLPAVLLLAPLALMRALTREPAERDDEARVPAVQVGMVWVLLGVLLLPLFGRLGGLPGWAHLLLTLVAAAALAAVWWRLRRVRQLLLFLSPLIVLFPAIFLLRPGIRDQWWRPSLEATASTAEARTVVLLVFDALPLTSLLDESYQVDPVRYPSFAQLAGTSTWYRRARASAPNTELALPAILSGRCAKRGRPPTFAAYPKNLFTLLGRDYRHDALERITDLCPPALCEQTPSPSGERLAALASDTAVIFAHWIVPPGWRGRLPSIDTAWGGFLDGGGLVDTQRGKKPAQVEELRAQLARIEPGDERLHLFSHILLPHNPFFFLPSGRRYRTDANEPGGTTSVFSSDPWVAAHSYLRHLLQLGFTDRLLGEWIERLEETGRWQEALVVVTADHGVSFRPNEPRRSPTPGNAVDILPVPLFIKRPGQSDAEVVDLPAQGLDTLPLMAEALGISQPDSATGRSRTELEQAVTAQFPCHPPDDVMTIALPDEAIRARVDEKLALFGSGATGGPVPAVGPRPDLLGLATSAACGPQARVRVTLHDERAFADVSTGSNFIPAEIVGVATGLSPGETVDLAVAVNGSVRATTRSYLYGAANASRWSAIVPESAFVDGANRVEVFVANARGERCPISPTGPATGEVSYLGVRLGLWEVPGVTVRGFRKITLRRGRQVRWSGKRGRIEVPLADDEAAALREIRIDLADLGPDSVQLKVRVNRRTVVDELVTEGPWSGRFPVRVDETPVRIILESNTVARGKRELGVAVEGIWLGDGSGELVN